MIRYVLVKRDESANEFEVQMEWHWFIFKRRLNKNKFIIENNNLKFIDKIISFYNNCINCIKEWCNECKLRIKN